MRRNPKIARVLTTNYDFFFGATWPRYTSMRNSWWPSTKTSTGTRLEGAGPILYVHGYLPYSGGGEKDVVITQADYDQTYSGTGDHNDGFARDKLINTIDNYHLIFIGFSFSDSFICNSLRRSNTKNQKFAFLHKSESNAIQAAKNAGVIPVELTSWLQLPDLLGEIYCAGLTPEELKRTGKTPQEYWSTLQKGLEPR
jgi:hypothetical protein